LSRQPRGDVVRLGDIAAAARRIGEYTEGGIQPFLESTMVQDAVIRQLEVIGEAAGNVSGELRKSHPEVPWRALRGFASFAKHEYWRVDLKLVWKAAQGCRSIRVAVDRIRVG
jgi:uncharacterized protein with HEPN domain